MAEMLLYMIDRTGIEAGIDVYSNAKLSQRGDVVTVQEDGWQWGETELTDPRFQVVSVPDATVADLQPLLSYESPMPGDEEDLFHQLNNTLQYRGFHIVVDAVAALQQADPPPVVLSSLAEVTAATQQKTPIPDPARIGTPPAVIG